MTTIIRILTIVAAIFTALFFASLYIPFGIIGLAGTALLRAVFMRNKISPPQANETQPLYKAKV